LRKDSGLRTVSCRRTAGAQQSPIGEGRVPYLSRTVVWILAGLMIAGDVVEVESGFLATHAADGRATAAGSGGSIDGRGRIGARLRSRRGTLRRVGVVVGEGGEGAHRMGHGGGRRQACCLSPCRSTAKTTPSLSSGRAAMLPSPSFAASSLHTPTSPPSPSSLPVQS